MEGSLLRFYVHEQSRVHGRPVWEWLLEEARRLGIRGGSVFRAMAGYGRDRVLHEERFFELAGTVTIEVEFIVTDDEATRLLELVKDAELRLFHARVPARFGVTGDPAG
jgi:PII-like signaling protein